MAPSAEAAAGLGADAAAGPGADALPPWDVVVGSDLIYYTYSEATPHSRLLLAALRQLAGAGTLVVLSLSLHHNPEEVGPRPAGASKTCTSGLCAAPTPSPHPSTPPHTYTHNPCFRQVEQFLRWAGDDGFDVSHVPPHDVPEVSRAPRLGVG